MSLNEQLTLASIATASVAQVEEAIVHCLPHLFEANHSFHGNDFWNRL